MRRKNFPQSGWQVGALFGIPLLLDPSWFVILLGVTWVYSITWQDMNWETNVAWIAGFIMALMLSASVVLHELGHSLVARSQGIKVNSITLFLMGGIASIDQESKTPGQAFQVAIAGPAVSFVLFLLLSGVQRVHGWSEPATAVLTNLAGINLVLALFNMLPGLPLDGGQVLKAAIWKVTGDRFQGVRWAARAGQTLGWTAVFLGIVLFLRYRALDALWIAMLGWFAIRNANIYTSVTRLQESLLSIKAADAMTRDFRVVDANWTLRQFGDHHLLTDDHPAIYYAASDGRYRGLVSIEMVKQIDRSLWDTQTLQDIAQDLAEISSVSETASLAEAVEQLETQEARRLTVLSPAGAVSGVIDRGDIVQAIAKKMKVPIADSLIQQIKEQGVYPPTLPLPAIAKAARESEQ